MNTALLQQYHLQFIVTRDVRNNLEPGVDGDGGLSEFLDDLSSSRLTKQFLEKTSLYLKGGSDPEGNNRLLPLDTFSAELSADLYVHLPDSLKQVQVLPLQDFHDILQMWWDFLLQNGC